MEAWRCVEDGICSPEDCDTAVSQVRSIAAAATTTTAAAIIIIITTTAAKS